MESLVFLKQYFQNFHSTGAVLPSGRLLARALCRHALCKAGDSAASRQILEVGPGTGAVTRRLVQCVGPADRLTLIELNDAFVAHLRQRFAGEPAFQAVADRSRIVQGRLEEMPAEPKFDFIISGLPLNNFSVENVEQILAVYRRLLAPGGVLSFFEYMAVRPVKRVISGASERLRLTGIQHALDALYAAGKAERDWVWPNVPPAWVNHVRFG